MNLTISECFFNLITSVWSLTVFCSATIFVIRLTWGVRIELELVSSVKLDLKPQLCKWLKSNVKIPSALKNLQFSAKHVPP